MCAVLGQSYNIRVVVVSCNIIHVFVVFRSVCNVVLILAEAASLSSRID